MRITVPGISGDADLPPLNAPHVDVEVDEGTVLRVRQIENEILVLLIDTATDERECVFSILTEAE